MTYPRGHAHRRALKPAARRAQRRSIQRSRFDPRWLLPALALAAPLAGPASESLLHASLMLAAMAGLVAIGSTGAFWSLILWGGVTGGLGALLAFRDAPNGQSLILVVLPVVAIQALALLGVGRPATTAGWRARGWVLLSLCGPLALAVLTLKGASHWRGLEAALAVSLDLAALPLVLEARRRARP